MNLTHLNEDGYARMVDVSGKLPTQRTALAEGVIKLGDAVMKILTSGNSPKGNVLNTAIVAGIQSVKKTSELIPMCHPLPLQGVDIRFEFSGNNLRCFCAVSAEAKTGFEMEALVGVTTALLTVYDMLKAVDKSMEISGIRLLEKTGGKSGTFKADGWNEK
ncbi:MAG: cyclic pyranopterin monophosphate synthase MoaC [Candidatus Fermentibacteria bacterium]|nr:cyclic pyranopterin monophosphate synthase MoaC [Candidatus Fermentibacteria bacterium]